MYVCMCSKCRNRAWQWLLKMASLSCRPCQVISFPSNLLGMTFPPNVSLLTQRSSQVITMYRVQCACIHYRKCDILREIGPKWQDISFNTLGTFVVNNFLAGSQSHAMHVWRKPFSHQSSQYPKVRLWRLTVFGPFKLFYLYDLWSGTKCMKNSRTSSNYKDLTPDSVLLPRPTTECE
jgi:hypothetical protein